MTVLTFLTDPFAYEFMQRSLLVTVVASIVCALLSCWLVLIGWSLLGDAVSHAVLPGVVLSYVVGIPFAAGALVFGFGAVALIGAVRDTTRLKEDAVIGVVFTSLFALGIVLVSVTPSHIDLTHILFGNLLGVTDLDIGQVLVLGTLTAVVLVVKRRDLTLLAFDPVHAHAIGLSPRRLRALLLAALAVTVVVALQAVGVILVVAMVITPGATAFLLTDRISRMLVVAPVVAALCAVAGMYASYYLDASSAGMIVLAQGLAFGLAYAATWRSRSRRA
ncbi:ABC-type Mn2+/Zn2+ transport system, permease component [Sanguibacter keddieii DSM 10542]|uniref:ABC-type Mn2+/Zn2+ transport system, permease component n=1 Tax=Sanguibacter keddieii (strain ATCC 51767 / DSM 10542 / NCFB 3025 / ST-74) TaxID=446469 RepID=D1BEI3_SANKS|nr:metal ABC transporter permease [Sanguibacter keddieii]ACZ21261.1 ABC-type Mn2+/Zn2+ transport system, permease component [Sanguibacter keddieii DSM 10542]